MSTSRYVNEVVEVTRDCDLGSQFERGVVTEILGKYMTVVFPNRKTKTSRVVHTGTDYAYLCEAGDD